MNVRPSVGSSSLTRRRTQRHYIVSILVETEAGMEPGAPKFVLESLRERRALAVNITNEWA